MVMGVNVKHPGPTSGQELRKAVVAVIGSITYAATAGQQDTTASPKDKSTPEVIGSLHTILSAYYDLMDTFRNRKD